MRAFIDLNGKLTVRTEPPEVAAAAARVLREGEVQIRCWMHLDPDPEKLVGYMTMSLLRAGFTSVEVSGDGRRMLPGS